MPAQLVADHERMPQPVDEGLLFGCERIRLAGVYSGEVGVEHWIRRTIERHRAVLAVDEVQQVAVVHTPLGAPCGELPFEFELYDGNGFVHPGQQQACLLVGMAGGVGNVGLGYLRAEPAAFVISVGFHGECGQRHQVDSVSVLKCGHVAVAEGYPQHVCNTCRVAGCGAHPEGVVVAPLEVEPVVAAKHIHY